MTGYLAFEIMNLIDYPRLRDVVAELGGELSRRVLEASENLRFEQDCRRIEVRASTPSM
jgi:hypothetical protein